MRLLKRYWFIISTVATPNQTIWWIEIGGQGDHHDPILKKIVQSDLMLKFSLSAHHTSWNKPNACLIFHSYRSPVKRPVAHTGRVISFKTNADDHVEQIACKKLLISLSYFQWICSFSLHCFYHTHRSLLARSPIDRDPSPRPRQL